MNAIYRPSDPLLLIEPHCGMGADSTSGGEVAERELHRHLPALVKPTIVRPSWRGLRWWNSLAYFYRPLKRALGPAYWSKHCRPPGLLLRAHSLRYTGLPALWWGRKLHVPVSVHYHHLDGGPLRWLDRFVITHADQVTTDSYFSCDQAFHWNHRITVVRLGVDHQRFTPAPRPGIPFVLLVGGTKRRKQTDFVRRLWPQVVARVPTARLLEIGQGVPFSSRGPVPDFQVTEWYRRARVVAMPSRLEGFGLPVLEAMASARPVVCSDQGALPEFGIETTPLVPELWVDRLARLLTDDAQWAKESEANLERSADYSWEKTAADFTAAWRRIA